MTVSTLDLPREMIEQEQYATDYYYEDLDEEVGRILGQRKKTRDESEADNDE